MSQGFGKPQPTQIDKLAKRAVRYCQKRKSEKLDQIPKKIPAQLYQQVLMKTVSFLHNDIDSLSWLCGYFAAVINCSEDNQKRYCITLSSKLLIKSGMEAFEDFVPYPGCRLVIVNKKKFEALPEKVRMLMQEVFDLNEASEEEVKRINDALLEELMVEK